MKWYKLSSVTKGLTSPTKIQTRLFLTLNLLPFSLPFFCGCTMLAGGLHPTAAECLPRRRRANTATTKMLALLIGPKGSRRNRRTLSFLLWWLVGLSLCWQLIKKTDKLSWNLLIKYSDVTFPPSVPRWGPLPSCGQLHLWNNQQLWVWNRPSVWALLLIRGASDDSAHLGVAASGESYGGSEAQRFITAFSQSRVLTELFCVKMKLRLQAQEFVDWPHYTECIWG